MQVIKNITIVIGLLILAGVGYFLFVTNKATTLEGDSTGSGAVTIQSAVFLQRLHELQSVTLNDSIFTDERFRSLEDFGTQVERVSYGRSQPFAAVDGDTTVQTLSTNDQ